MNIPTDEKDLIKRYFEYALTFEELLLVEQKRLTNTPFDKEVATYEATIFLFKKAVNNNLGKSDKRAPITNK